MHDNYKKDDGLNGKLKKKLAIKEIFFSYMKTLTHTTGLNPHKVG